MRTRRPRLPQPTPLHIVTLAAPPPAPEHLTEAARAWWDQMCERWDFDAHDLKTLGLAANMLDRAEQARQEIARTGLMTVDSKGGVGASPAVRVERESSLAFRVLVRSLDLPDGAAEMSPQQRAAWRSNQRV